MTRNANIHVLDGSGKLIGVATLIVTNDGISKPRKCKLISPAPKGNPMGALILNYGLFSIKDGVSEDGDYRIRPEDVGLLSDMALPSLSTEAEFQVLNPVVHALASAMAAQ